MKKLLWIFWLLLTLGVVGYYAFTMLFSENKADLLIGESTYGHYQIELACTSCHTQPFGGKEILQNACMNCHAQELDDAKDSHPKKKFTDSRNADAVAILDARYCISCHTEHHKEQTHPMGLTLPTDYCFHCHQDIGKERPSHKDAAFDSCASAGCHNYHDNRALYENFLVDHAQEPWLAAIAQLSSPNNAHQSRKANAQPLTIADADAPVGFAAQTRVHEQWAATAHAAAGVNCSGCHQDSTASNIWIDKPGLNQCKTCHQNEAQGFVSGKHGMRLSAQLSTHLSAVTPNNSPMQFKTESMNHEQNCSACHNAHDFNVKKAAASACLTCHNDKHSLAFEQSPHGRLWQQEMAQEIPVGTGVSCATCHMPRIVEGSGEHKKIRVEHNQNLYLRPNEKMIRSVCMNCHGLEFAIDALADPALIENNLSGTPSVHIQSIDWALKRAKEQ